MKAAALNLHSGIALRFASVSAKRVPPARSALCTPAQRAERSLHSRRRSEAPLLRFSEICCEEFLKKEPVSVSHE